MSPLATLLNPFLQIVVRRAGPEHLPASGFLLSLVTGGYLLVSLLSTTLAGAEGARLVGLPLLDLGLQTIFFTLVLTSMGLPGRLLQTLTAAFGADALLTLFSLPMLLVDTSNAGSMVSLLTGLGFLALILWSLGIKGHILQRATGIPYVVAVLIALGLFVALYSLDITLFGAA